MKLPDLTTTKSVQIVFFALLVTCSAQITWWVVDVIHDNQRLREQALENLDRDLVVAHRMDEAGVPRPEIFEQFPHLEATGEGSFMVRAESLANLERVHDSRLNRYRWEGAFFLVTLVGGMVILTRALRQQVRLRRREEDFLAAVSHELKSPLASIRLAAETLSLRRADPERQERVLTRILEDVDRLETMVTNILDTNRVHQKRRTRITETVDLKELTRSCVETQRRRLLDPGISMDFQANGEELAIQADPAAVQAVVANLLDNAAKAIRGVDGGEIQVLAERTGDSVSLTVRDNGIGFPPGKTDLLFQKFYRLGQEMRRKTPGSGLGLYLVRRLVEMNGGSVEGKSPGPGQGAEFRITWPCSREASS